VSVLTASHVSVRIGVTEIVRDAALSLNAGELVALVGPNGAGKTTLMRALAGLVRAQGSIILGGKPLDSMKPRDRARAVAYLPQGHIFHWPMPVDSIVMLGRTPHADPFSSTSPEDRAAVEHALARTETLPFAERAVTTLSGGEKARVALARALATQAPVLLADEPTAALDPRHQLVVMELLRTAAHGGNAVLAIMHDLTLAARFADRVLVMQGGRIVADGLPGDALSEERLAEVFGISVESVEAGGGRIPIAIRAL
jgi:iron complex transport system ATP-binding protein